MRNSKKSSKKQSETKAQENVASQIDSSTQNYFYSVLSNNSKPIEKEDILPVKRNIRKELDLKFDVPEFQSSKKVTAEKPQLEILKQSTEQILANPQLSKKISVQT